MAAPTFIASTTAAPSGGSGTGFTISVPTGTLDGDTMFMFVGADPGTTPTVTGWTFLESKAMRASGATSLCWLYYRTASSEPGSYSPSMTSSSTCWGTILTYRGTVTIGSAHTPRGSYQDHTTEAAGTKTDTLALVAGPDAMVNQLIFYVEGATQCTWIASAAGSVTPDAGATLRAGPAFMDAGSGSLQNEMFTVSEQWVGSAAAQPAVSTTDSYATGPAGNRTTHSYLIEFSTVQATDTPAGSDSWAWSG